MFKHPFLYVFLLPLLCIEVKSQNGLFINGNNASLTINSNSKIYVNGDVQNINCSSVEGFTNNGTVILTGNFINNDSLFNDRPSNLVPGSDFIFTGSADQTIRGNASTPFFKLKVNKPGGEIQLQRNIYIKDTLHLVQGNINLKGKNIEMRYPSGLGLSTRNPFIFDENSNNRIYGDSGSVFVSTIKDAGKPNNLANIGLTIMDHDSKNITIKRGHTKQLYAGNGSVKRYFDVSSDFPLNTGNGDSLFVHYINAEITPGTDPNYFKIFVSPGSDIDYVQLPSTNLLSIDEVHTKTEALALPDVQVNLKQFRITIADNNCSNPPVSQLTSDTLHLCAGNSILLNAGNQTSIPNTSLKWKWSTGESIQSIWVKSLISYQNITVKLTDVRGCTTNDTIIITPTAPSPISNFTHTNVCLGDSITFITTSSIVLGSYNSYWQFGDGSTSNTSLNQFKKLYNTPGKFYVNLGNTSNYGCVSSKLDSVVIFPPPTADYTSGYNCSINKMEFTDASTANFGNIKNWFWNTGENSDDTVLITSPIPPSIIKNYTIAGTYNTSLIVTTFQGCKDTVQKQVIIHPKNQALFTVSNVCFGDTLHFFNSSVCNTGMCNYNWSYNDGSNSTQTNPEKKYNNSGAYNVKLKIGTPQGCPDSVTKTVFVNPLPVTNFNSSTNDICLGNTVYFSNQSNIPLGGLTYLWDFGNGDTTHSINGTQTFNLASAYTVKLTAASDSGCTTTAVKIVTVHNNPIAEYQVDTVCSGSPSVFNSTSTGTNLSYDWDMGNATTSIAIQPSYTYPFPGGYNTRLIITDTYGCSDSAYEAAVIIPLPAAVLSEHIFTCGDSYILNAGTLATSYLWLPANIITPSIQITENGTYTLQSTNSNGCSAIEQTNVTLNSQVQPNLGSDTTVCGNYILNAGYPGSIYLWNNAQTEQKISIQVSGVFSVQIKDQNNCTGSDSIKIVINPAVSVSLGNEIVQCKNTTPVLLSPINNIQNYLWNTGSTTASIFVNQSGFYWIKATDNNNCFDYDTIQVNLLPTPLVNLGNDITVCSQALLDAQNIGNFYLWSDGSTSESIEVNAESDYWVLVTDPANGCYASDTIHITVNDDLNVFLGNDTTICSNTNFNLDAGNIGANYLWNTGSTSQTISISSSGLFFVEVSRGNCSTSDYINITLSTMPELQLGKDIQYICSSNPIQLNSNITGNYTWGSINGFTSNLPAINITQAGQYWLTVDKDGCTASDTVNVIDSPYSIKAYFLAATTDSINKPIQFIDLSEPKPLSYSWDFGDGFYSDDANPIHTFLQAQAFDVKLKVSNGYCTDHINKTLTLLKKSNDVIHLPVDKLELTDFKLFPNPTSDNIYIQMSLNDYAPIELYMYDVNGRILLQQNVANLIDYYTIIDVSRLSSGLYFIQLVANSRKGVITKTTKLVKVQ